MTSIIIVAFTTLLLVTVTVSFLSLMIGEQTRSNNSELSQGAYDSALAGIEDGKRALELCRQSGDENSDACKKIDKQACTTVSDSGLAVADSNGEVYLKTTVGSNGRDFEQAYTCVKITRNTTAYIGGPVDKGASAIIKLNAVKPFAAIALSWAIPNQPTPVLPPVLAGDVSLPLASDWDAATPALMRVQLIKYNSGDIGSTDFDTGDSSHTIYLSPAGSLVQTPQTHNFGIDLRRSGTLAPQYIICSTFPAQGYNCKTTITIPGGADRSNTYLRLMAMYNAANYKVQLLAADGSVVLFDGVQPLIESTGRAADVFRQVSANVEYVDLNDTSLYPRATVDVTDNFCKVLYTSSNPSDYKDNKTVCDPASPSP